MADINFNNKVQSTGITKEEFVKSLTDKKIEQAVAQSIFDKFNTNAVGDSADVLDKNEQVGLVAFLKKLSGSDTNITDEEFNAGLATAKEFGIESQEILSGVVDTFTHIVDADAKDDVDVKFESDGSVKVGDETYTYDDNGGFKQVTSKVGDKEVTQTLKQKYDPVSLSANWKNQRDIASKITSGAEGFKEIKSAKTADQVLDIIIAQQGLEVTDEQKTQLKELLIKFNPSMFNKDTGAVWVNADWSKLDFPSGTDVAGMISGTSSTASAGDTSAATSTTSASDVSTGTKASTQSASNATDPKATNINNLATAVHGNIYSSNGSANIISALDDALKGSDNDIVTVLDAYAQRRDGKSIVADLNEKAKTAAMLNPTNATTARTNAARVSINVLSQLVKKAEDIGLVSNWNQSQCPEYVTAKSIISSYSEIAPAGGTYISAPDAKPATNIMGSSMYIHQKIGDKNADIWINNVDNAIKALSNAIRTKQAQST